MKNNNEVIGIRIVFVFNNAIYYNVSKILWDQIHKWDKLWFVRSCNDHMGSSQQEDHLKTSSSTIQVSRGL
jgi:hypothetical protein